MLRHRNSLQKGLRSDLKLSSFFTKKKKKAGTSELSKWWLTVIPMQSLGWSLHCQSIYSNWNSKPWLKCILISTLNITESRNTSKCRGGVYLIHVHEVSSTLKKHYIFVSSVVVPFAGRCILFVEHCFAGAWISVHVQDGVTGNDNRTQSSEGQCLHAARTSCTLVQWPYGCLLCVYILPIWACPALKNNTIGCFCRQMTHIVVQIGGCVPKH